MTSNARAWVFWIAAAALLAVVIRNPFYILVLLLVSQVMIVAFARPTTEFRLPLLRLGLFIVAFSAIYNALFVHVGDVILLQLPDWPLVGGDITMEALLDGAINGLKLLALLSVFMALNAIVPVSELVRLAPAALQDLGIVLLVAVTYVPETRRHLRRIREAQAIRGHRLRGLRDWQPLVIPLLVGGLERAMRLAETMVARGYGATNSQEQGLAERAGLVSGLLLAFAGWIVVVWSGWPGWLLIGAGLVILLSVIWRRGRHAPRTVYRASTWSITELLLVATAAVALVLVALPTPLVDRSTLGFSALPQLHLPGFDLFLGLTIAALALPALFGRRWSNDPN